MKKWMAGGALMVLAFVGVWFASRSGFSDSLAPTLFSGEPNPSATPSTTGANRGIEIIAENLTVPWEIAFLPGGELLATERPGRLVKIGQEREVISIEGVQHRGEGGLLGLALHPNFSENRWLYIYLTTRSNGGLTNRVERYELNGTTLSNRLVILENIPGAANHDGGRIAFGPDGLLYITTGDAQSEESAQDTASLAGKILRVTDTGEIPGDNPFDSAVYSYGHRNPQGLAWDDQGRLWSTEHGPSGFESGHDELNLIEKGKNYGWPRVRGDEQQGDMILPVIHSGADETWAPASAAFTRGSVFFAGLRGEALYEYRISDKQLIKHLVGEYGRLRAIVVGPDDSLYLTTSNTDGRGSKRSGDDKIINIPRESLR